LWSVETHQALSKPVQDPDAATPQPSLSQSLNGKTTQLSLSPSVDHQLTQAYELAKTAENGISFDDKTGWIMGNGSDYLFWVHPDQMDRLYRIGGLQFVIPGPTVQVDLSKFSHGMRWTECSHLSM